ncbi:unnamed protein product, partial [Brassica oleracea]
IINTKISTILKKANPIRQLATMEMKVIHGDGVIRKYPFQ